MSKTAIFAHYDKNNEIENYVIYYLEELKKIANNLIFVSDCDIKENELQKIKHITNNIIAKHHGEYDFGSYKYGYLYAKENNLLNVDELIFANDSCFGPLIPFGEIWNKMNQKECDFWGITANPNGIEYSNSTPNTLKVTKDYHIQSYFLCFKKQVFQDKEFINFIKSIKKEEKKENIIINYEIGLSKLLYNCSYKSEVYCALSNQLADSHLKYWRKLILENNSPFIKRSLILHKILEIVYPLFLKTTLRKVKFNYEIIKHDIIKNRQQSTLKTKYKPIKNTIKMKYY